LYFCGECSTKKLSSQNENSKIFEKNERHLDEIPAFAGMTVVTAGMTAVTAGMTVRTSKMTAGTVKK
jgi:hypothetical protein